MPFGADRVIFWSAGIETLTALKKKGGALPREGSLIPATTVRAIAGAAGGVCAAATTVRPATPNSAVAVAKRIASSENRNGLTDISQVATGSPPREEVTLRSRRLARIRSPGSPSKPFQLLDDCQKGRGKAGPLQLRIWTAGRTGQSLNALSPFTGPRV